MTYETELKPADLSADELDAVVGGSDLDSPLLTTSDLKMLKKSCAPEPGPGIIAII